MERVMGNKQWRSTKNMHETRTEKSEWNEYWEISKERVFRNNHGRSIEI